MPSVGFFGKRAHGSSQAGADNLGVDWQDHKRRSKVGVSFGLSIGAEGEGHRRGEGMRGEVNFLPQVRHGLGDLQRASHTVVQKLAPAMALG